MRKANFDRTESRKFVQIQGKIGRGMLRVLQTVLLSNRTKVILRERERKQAVLYKSTKKIF